MDALILCGGYATRLDPISRFIPKPLLPINGRPVIDYIVDDLHIIGVERIVMSTNRRFSDQLEYWMRHKKAMGKINSLELIVEPTEDNATKLGAIKGINYAIKKTGLKDDIMIIAGDNYYDFSMRGFMKQFQSTRKPTICVYDIKDPEKTKHFGVVTMEKNVITGFEEKPEHSKSTLVSMGVYALPAQHLIKFKEYLDDDKNPDNPGFFMKWLIETETVYGCYCEGIWYDIGNIEAYERIFAETEKTLTP